MAGRSKRISILPPLAVFTIVGFFYFVYLCLHLLPQLQRLQWLQPSSTPIQQSVPNDPHMYPASASEVIATAVLFHLFFSLFLSSFFQAMVTHPGRVPANDPKWERGAFDVSEKEDREVERIIRDTRTDLTHPHVRALLQRMPTVERKKAAALPGRNDEESPLSPSTDPDDLKRKCHACMVYKPDRVHHCSVCGYCVLRMDHHCE